MYRCDDPTNTTTFPTPAAAGTPGYYAQGAQSGSVSTIVRADHLNAMQEELSNAVIAFGYTLTKGTNNQLATGLTSILTELTTFASEIAANALAISTETGRAEAAENALGVRITTEVNRAEAAENNILVYAEGVETNVTNETAARESVDNSLQAQINLRAPSANPAFSGYVQVPEPPGGASDNSNAAVSTNFLLTSLLNGGDGILPFDGNSNGYIRLPSGMFIQWGTQVSTGNGVTLVNFPIAFSNVCLQAWCCEGSAQTWGTNKPSVHGIYTHPSATQMDIVSASWNGSAWVVGAGLGFNWIAVGY